MNMNLLLIKRVKKHDKAAFQKLMEKQATALYNTAKVILMNEEELS